MKYATDAAFRAALEQRLQTIAEEHRHTSLMRLRKLVVFDRLMARLLVVAPDRWVVKGGVALDLRLGHRARTTKDLDLARQDSQEQAEADLIDTQAIDLGDYFVVAVERTDVLEPDDDETAVRYRVTAELAGRLFDRVVVDIGFGDPLPVEPDYLQGLGLLAFAGVPPITVPALPLDRHVAEKVHAYTRTYEGERSSSRVKDLVDLVLIPSAAAFDAGHLYQAIRGTFQHRRGHAMPQALPPPPVNWATPYRRLAGDLGLELDIAVGHRQAASFLDPILGGHLSDTAQWDPLSGTWSTEDSQGAKADRR